MPFLRRAAHAESRADEMENSQNPPASFPHSVQPPARSLGSRATPTPPGVFIKRGASEAVAAAAWPVSWGVR